MNKTLVIMRGISSTGKSYRARQILQEYQTRTGRQDGAIYSTDDYFYTEAEPDKPKKYSYTLEELPRAHRWNQQRVLQAIAAGEPMVIVDNTNTTASEFCCGYVKPALLAGYNVWIREPTSTQWRVLHKLLRNKILNKEMLDEIAKHLVEVNKDTHEVPLEAIQRQMTRWECDLDLETVVRYCQENHLEPKDDSETLPEALLPLDGQ